MLISDYIQRVREKLSDTIAPYRFTSTEISASLNEALQRVRGVRPSLCYQAGRIVEPADDVNFAAAISTTVRSELDRYAEGLVFMAAARVLANDNSDTNNIAVAEKWRTQGLELLTI